MSQPKPKQNDHTPTVDEVIKDLQARKELGLKRYGTYLQPHNGRDSLLDAYEEAMDLVIYLKNRIREDETN